MNTIFIVSADKKYFNLFATNFGHLPIHFAWARGMDEVLKYADIEQPAYLFFISRDLETMADLIADYRKLPISVPFVCFTRELDYPARSMLWQSGAIDIISFPIARKELEYILKSFLVTMKETQEADEQLTGRLEDFSLIELIQTFQNSGKSGRLVLESGSRRGEIEFNNGKVVNATYPNCEALEAVTVLSTWTQGRFYGRFDKEKHPRKIVLDNEQVIAECINHQKELNDLYKELPQLDETLYTDPDIEYEEFGAKDRKLMLKFWEGYTLQQLLNEFDGNVNTLLKKIKFWLERHWLLTSEQYEKRKAQIEARQRRSMFKKLFGKMFSRKEEEFIFYESTGRTKVSDEDEDFLAGITRKEAFFYDFESLQEFVEKLEKQSG